MVNVCLLTHFVLNRHLSFVVGVGGILTTDRPQTPVMLPIDRCEIQVETAAAVAGLCPPARASKSRAFMAFPVIAAAANRLEIP
jgi:hypothetical protein